MASLRKAPGEGVVIMGSGDVIRYLTKRSLIDEYVLLIHPLILGEGKRLFADDGSYASLQLVSSKTTGKGVLIATYRPSNSK